MSYSLSQYQAKLAQWRKQYGVPPPPRVFNLTAEAVACVKNGCGRIKRIQRHHTGNDFWFALLLPDDFAAQYVQFRKEDTANLCDDCHKHVHKLYKSIMKDVWAELNEGGQRIITKEWCEKWMAYFRKRFRRWANTPKRKRRRRRKRV